MDYNDLADIEIKTLKDEEQLLPDFALAEGGLESARQEFRQAVMENKYCGINFELIEKQWKAFFHRLQKDLGEQEKTRFD